jgi:hypothetical protein
LNLDRLNLDRPSTGRVDRRSQCPESVDACLTRWSIMLLVTDTGRSSGEQCGFGQCAYATRHARRFVRRLVPTTPSKHRGASRGRASISHERRATAAGRGTALPLSPAAAHRHLPPYTIGGLLAHARSAGRSSSVRERPGRDEIDSVPTTS